jgi:hypothetical protein
VLVVVKAPTCLFGHRPESKVAHQEVVAEHGSRLRGCRNPVFLTLNRRYPETVALVGRIVLYHLKIRLQDAVDDLALHGDGHEFPVLTQAKD